MTHRALAKINRTTLGIEDHGILTAFLDVSYEGASGQGIGGYALDTPTHDDEGKFAGRVGTAQGMEFIARLIRACGVESWEKLPGTMIYVLKENDSFGSSVLGVQGLGFGKESEPFIFKSLWPERVAS